MAEDPDLEAFRAKLKQGGGMSHAARASRQRAVQWVVAFVLVGSVFGGVKLAQQHTQARKDAASAKEDADRRAKVDAEMAESAAFDARYAPVATAAQALDPRALDRAAPSLVAGRKILGLLATTASVFEKETQGAGGVFAASPAEVGVVVTMAFDILKDRVVTYEGGAVLAPTRKTFIAIAWPEKKVVATWTELWTPPRSVRVMRVGKTEMPMELGATGSRWKADAEKLAAGVAPTSMVE
jgi:hypothetical protein